MLDSLAKAFWEQAVTAGLALVSFLLIPILWQWTRGLLGRPAKERQETYSERVSRLTESLSKASSDVDEVLEELSRVSTARALRVTELGAQLDELSNQEARMRSRIDALEQVPLEAVQHLQTMLDQGDRRSAYRDYMLFGLGVVVSTAIAIVLRLVGY